MKDQPKKHWTGHKGEPKSNILFDYRMLVGRRLATFLPQWQKRTANRYILNIVVKSYTLEFNAVPPERFLLTKLLRDPEKVHAQPLLLGEMVDHECLFQSQRKKCAKVSILMCS